MAEVRVRGCEHCRAAPAAYFATDGKPVCDTCFSYNQIQFGELRAAQLSSGVPQGGSPEKFLRRVLRRGRAEFVFTLVLGAISIFLLRMGRHEPVALACGIVTTLLTIASTLHAISILRYAREEAPQVYRRVSSRPPPRMRVRPSLFEPTRFAPG